MLKNLYIRKGDESYWAWAEKQAEAKGQALSVWVSNLIRNQKYAAGSNQIVETTLQDQIARVRQELEQMQEMLP